MSDSLHAFTCPGCGTAAYEDDADEVSIARVTCPDCGKYFAVVALSRAYDSLSADRLIRDTGCRPPE